MQEMMLTIYSDMLICTENIKKFYNKVKKDFTLN